MREGAAALASRIALLTGSALVLAFYSELFFLNEGPTWTAVGGFRTPSALLPWAAELIAWYALFASWFLVGVARYRARSVWAVFLAGCLFGWATEGLIIPVLYEALPGSIVWPSVGWHALVDVLLGWWLVRRVLLLDRPGLTALLALGMGTAWGLWATWLQAGDSPPLAAGDYALFAWGAGALCVCGNIVLDRFATRPFVPTRGEVVVLVVLSGGLWLVSTGSWLPGSLVLPLLVLVTGHALARNRAVEHRPDLLEATRGHCRIANHLTMLLMPAAASVTYPVWLATELSVEPGWVAWPLVAGGTVMLPLSLVMVHWQAFRGRSRSRGGGMPPQPPAGS